MRLEPTPPGERDRRLDILRGAALFGVLLENMQYFVEPTYASLAAGPEAHWADRLGLAALRLACDHKVYGLFAFLFGYGTALQGRRTGAGGFVSLHLWRMAVLALIGLAHSLVWEGDILLNFALLGLLLLPLRRLPGRGLAALGAVALLLPFAVRASLAAWSARLEPAQVTAVASWLALYDYPARQTCFSFGALLWGFASARGPGLAALARAAAPRLPGLLAFALVANFVAVVLYQRLDRAPLSTSALLSESAQALGAPTLAAWYALALARALERPALRRRLAPLADAGRATLSNYLLQSLVGVGLLRRAGAIGPPLGSALAVGIFGLQLWASRAWLARHAFGPAEWLWRRISYAAALPPSATGAAHARRAEGEQRPEE